MLPSNEEAIISAPACPYYKVTGIEELDKEITCPCNHLREYMDREGRCPLGLFVKRS